MLVSTSFFLESFHLTSMLSEGFFGMQVKKKSSKCSSKAANDKGANMRLWWWRRKTETFQKAKSAVAERRSLGHFFHSYSSGLIQMGGCQWWWQDVETGGAQPLYLKGSERETCFYLKLCTRKQRVVKAKAAVRRTLVFLLPMYRQRKTRVNIIYQTNFHLVTEDVVMGQTVLTVNWMVNQSAPLTFLWWLITVALLKPIDLKYRSMFDRHNPNPREFYSNSTQ